ncbi:MAG: hypothetical protein M1827_002899 [Pycnora praestabilis]|nr:MAG: hypothetical protein M1827_002899 [Pycnora praestabilis]
MASSLSWLGSLKVSQLKCIASLIGANSGGTKAVLANELSKELRMDKMKPLLKRSLKAAKARDIHQGSPPRNYIRVLSIDMGIRNLAYCVLDIAQSGNKNTTNAPDSGPCKGISPQVHAWKRIGVSPETPSSFDAGAIGVVEDAFETKKEAFDPATYARYAYKLVSEEFLQYRPDIILIERQRYRSMGSPIIQEWTVRVNMFEAMLYAVLETVSEEGTWVGNVYAVAPAKVGPFWLEGIEAAPKRRAKTAKSKNKTAKIDLVGNWLERGDEIRLRDQAGEMGCAFLSKWRGKWRNSAATKSSSSPVIGSCVDVEGGLGKLDDLADCLLQGVAWIRWEENRRMFTESDLDKALEKVASITKMRKSATRPKVLRRDALDQNVKKAEA